MIQKGEVYKAQLSTKPQQAALVVIVSSNARNRSMLPDVTVLELAPRRDGAVRRREVAFELEGEWVKVKSHTLMVISKKDIEATPVWRINNALLDQIDSLIVRHFALYKAGSRASARLTGSEDNEAAL